MSAAARHDRHTVRRVCIYCGSRPGSDLAFATAAADVGRILGERGLGVVYGGGQVGLMGVVADAALAAGAEVIGVIPHGLAAREVDHDRLSKLHKVDTMHERKALMADLSDAFIALPGGIGTLEELTEMWSWAYLGIHRKPLGLLNVAGYFDSLLAFMDSALDAGFVQPVHRELLTVAETPESLVEAILAYEPPELLQWVSEKDR
jgi:uncharacterized protein (TIGR00730 family)